MSQLSKVLRDGQDSMLMFWCPGCDGAHGIRHGEGPKPRWKWNGDVNKPTFSPSILVTGAELTEKGRADMDAWFAAGKPEPSPAAFESKPSVCHSFVTDGNIQFLSDCTHALAGQTVPLGDWD